MIRPLATLLGALAALACMACAAPAAHAQLLLGAQAERVKAWPYISMLADPAGTLTIEQAIAARGRFGPPKGAFATLGMEREVTWLRLPVTAARGAEGPWVLDIDYALLRHVDLYVVADGKPSRHILLGDQHPYRERPLRTRSHAAILELAADHPLELYLRVDSPGAKILPITLSRLAAFHQRALAEQLLQGALTALGVFLFLFSLAQWASLREDLYLKYALLVACSVTFSAHFFGLGEMYLWSDVEWLQRHLAGMTSLMAAAATALFVEDVLDADLKPWLRRGLRMVAILHLALTVAYGLDWIDLRVVAVFMSTTGLAPALMGLPGALARARRGESIGTWFMIAWLGYFIASAILVGVVRGRIAANFWTLHSFQFGATLDMLIFMRIAVLRSAARHREAQRAASERDRLHDLAHRDPLTGLLNRRGLDDALPGAVARATPDRIVALYMLDLDGFKPVNDRHGHDVGDALLRAVAQRLRGCVRSGDAVARLGGDEFVVLAEGLPSESQAQELGQKILQSFRSPFSFNELNSRVTATVGYALAPLDGRDTATLLKAADAAMYAGKQDGKDRLLRSVP